MSVNPPAEKYSFMWDLYKPWTHVEFRKFRGHRNERCQQAVHEAELSGIREITELCRIHNRRRKNFAPSNSEA